MFNLLTEKLIRYRNSGGKLCHASLPEVYAALMADEVEAFPALRPHQRHAWHAFLVQLGAMAMHRAGLDTPPTCAEEWQRVIRALTPDWPEDEPWQLVVDDIEQPAFMQTPVSAGVQWKKDTPMSVTPDELDPLDTAKNHDLKRLVVPASDLDSWILALITEQTTDAHMANNPSISRISGRGSRLAISLTPSARLGRHFSRDVVALLSQWDLLGEDCDTTVNGHSLLWLVPWDGKKSLSLGTLHPLYIEVCRRRRLAKESNSGILYAHRVSGTTKRIAGNESLKGRTGDPWIPIDVKREKVLTLPPTTGFTYKRISDLITSGDWKLPLLCQPTREEATSSQTMYLMARGIAPGKAQNKTGGYYERIIPVRHKLKSAMQHRDSNDLADLGALSQGRINDVRKVRDFLRDAIATFITHGKDLQRDLKPNERQRVRADAVTWSNRLDEIVDDQFFDDLQIELEETDESHRRQIRNLWLLNDVDKNGVINHARVLLHDATDSLPCPAIYRYKALTNAEGLFEGLIRGGGGFPDLFQKADEEITEWQTNEQLPQTNSLTETQMTLFE